MIRRIRRLALLIPCVAVAACGGSADDEQRVGLDPASGGVQPAGIGTVGPAPTGLCGIGPVNPGPGDVDASFGCSGYAKYIIDDVDVTVRALAVQPDDKIVAVGETYDPAMNHHDVWAARFTSAGALDTTFATGGVYTKSFVPFGGPTSAETVVIQSTGAIVMAGGYFSEDTGAVRTGFMLRLLANGTLDTTFATAGILTTTSGFTYGRSLKIQANGNLVLAADKCTAPSTNCQAVVARFSANGVAYNGFGMLGYLPTHYSGLAPSLGRAAAVSGDNVVIAGRTSAAGTETNVALGRFGPNTIDNSFGTNGYVQHDTWDTETANGITNHGTGFVTVVGGLHASQYYFTFVRVLSTGALDNAFGFLGRYNVSFDGYGAEGAGVVYTNGKIVGAGWAKNSANKSRMAVTRITGSGQIDNTFSTNGYTMLSAGGDEAAATAVAVQSTGRIIAGGWARPAGGKKRAVLVRIRHD